MLLRLVSSRPDAEINKAIQLAVQQATQDWQPQRFEGQYPQSGFGIAILRAKELNVANGSTVTGTAQGSIGWIYSIATASTWTTMMNVTTNNDLYIVIEGVFCRQASPAITEIKFTVSGQELPIIGVEEMYTWDLARAYFDRPFIVRPEQPFKWETVGSKTSTAEYFGLLGHMIAKRSRLIKK